MEDYSEKDFDFFEAYPKKVSTSCEGNFKGPLELYKKLGFSFIREDGNYLVMRKK